MPKTSRSHLSEKAKLFLFGSTLATLTFLGYEKIIDGSTVGHILFTLIGFISGIFASNRLT